MALRAPGAGGIVGSIMGPRGQMMQVRMDGPGIRTPIIDYVKENLLYGGTVGWGGPGRGFPTRVTNAPVSVGPTRVPIQPPIPRVPEVSPPPPIKPPPILPDLDRTIDRRDPISTTSEVPKKVIEEIGDQIKMTIKGMGTVRGTPAFLKTIAIENNDQAAIAAINKHIGVTPTPTMPPIKAKQPEKTMDLGSLITDLGTAYIQTKYAQTPQPAVMQQPVFDFGLEPDIPFIDVVRKKKCRRRRRRLATLSDIRDLAALKSVLGDGQNLKTWIATHPS